MSRVVNISQLARTCALFFAAVATAASGAPADTNALLEKVANENRIPPIFLKAIAWQESNWTHRLVDGRINVSNDGGVGIMQVQNGDRNATEEQNIRAGAAKLMVKWQLNVDAGAQAAVNRIGGLPEDFQTDILENWFVPLAGYNGYSGTGSLGQGGGKGYARAVYSMLANPASYQNWRNVGQTASVAKSVQPYFVPRVQITDPKIIVGFDGGTASQIQPYSLCQIVKAGGRIHRYNFATKAVNDVTATIQPRCGAVDLPTGPVAVGAPAMPQQVQQNQLIKFAVATDKLADRVTVEFQSPIAEVELVGTGRNWNFERAISVAGTRPWVLRVYLAGKVTDERQRGTLTVLPSTTGPTIAGPVQAPQTVLVNEEMKVLVRTASAASKVSLDFGSNTSFDLQPDGSLTAWSWSKPMTQTGRRDYIVKVYAAGQSVPSDQRAGSVQVETAGSTVVNPLPNRSIARVLADSGYGRIFKSEHTGIDVMAPIGTVVKAMCEGTVINNYTTREVVNAFLIVRHNCGGRVLYGYYGHIASALAPGSPVAAGAEIGSVRMYGSNNHHLHFGINNKLISRGWGRAPLGTSRDAMLADGWLDPLDFLRNMPGYEATRTDPYIIGPSERVSRQQFGLSVIDAQPTLGARFNGTPEQRLRNAGLVQAEFRGADPIIRADAVRMTFRWLSSQPNWQQLLGNKSLTHFNLDGDLDDDLELRQQANSLAAAGIIGGIQNGTIYELEPAKQLSRTEQTLMVEKVRLLLSAAGDATPRILAKPNLPATVAQHARLAFTVNTDTAADKVLMVFTNPSGEVQLAGSGTQFAFDSAITVPGTRAWKLVVYRGTVVTDDQVTGTLVVTPGGSSPALQPWQVDALTYVNNYLEGRQRWTDCWDAGSGRRGTFCYRFARQAVGLPGMESAIRAFESLLDQGRASTASFESAPIGALVFYRIGTYGHVAVKMSETDVAGHGNELSAFTAVCPPITRSSHASLVAKAPYAGFYAPGGGSVTLDPNVIPAAQRVSRQDFLARLKSHIRDSRLAEPFGLPLSEPARAITRGEAALLLGRAITNLPPQASAAPHSPLTFADGGSGELLQMLNELSSRDIVQGQNNELAGGVNFFPGRQLSLMEADTLISRSTSLLAAKTAGSFPNVQVAATPASVVTGKPMTFTATLSTAVNVSKVELHFPAAAVTESMTRSEGSTWSRQRTMSAVTNGATFQIKVTMANGAAQVLGTGTYSVVPLSPADPIPVTEISAAQPLSTRKLNEPASFGLTGSNLSAATPPRVSLTGCDTASLTVVSATSARFNCTPRVAGAARLFWKQPGTDDKEFNLGQFTVLKASADGMAYLDDTPKDGQLYEGGARFTKTWQLKNTGTTTWTSAWCLRPQAGTALGSAPACVSGTVAPGASLSFSVPMTMPAAQAATVTLRQNWRLENAARAQVGPEVFAIVQVKAQSTGLQVVEPFSMPTGVRVNTEDWSGSVKLSGPASRVRMQLSGPQGAQQTLDWNATTATQWSRLHRFSVPGDYSWTLTAQGASGTDTRTGTVRVMAANTVTPVVTPSASARVELGKPWVLVVDTSMVATAVTVQFAGEGAVRLATADNRRFTLSRNFTTAGTQAYSLQASFTGHPTQVKQGSVQVDQALAPPPAPVPLNPVLTRSPAVMALQPWSATLRTDAPIYQADLVFKTGRRIPFDGGPTQWATRDENTRFSDAGVYDYELQLRRTASSAVEVAANGTLEVRALPVPSNPLRVTSPASVPQGQPYNLTLQTSAGADRVTVRWPDQSSEQALRPLDAARTQWEYGNRLFPDAGVLTYSVRSYKDGFAQPTGELQAGLQVTVPNASMRLLSISQNIIKGEQPYFTVETSLSVTQVTVKLGSLAAVPLQSSGPSGAFQNFRARVRVAEAGTVPYVITAFNAQGQAVGSPITGTVPVADVGDALTVPNPVPAEVARGVPVSWQFRTAQSANEMWAEFSAPIGTLPLTGYYLNQTFTAPAGVYSYRVMRRDHLGNVFPIQGAAGNLRLKDAVPVAVRSVSAAPAPGKVGQPMTFSVVLNQAAQVQRADLVFPDANVSEPLAQTAPDTWSRSRTMAQAGSNRPFRVIVTLADGSRLQQDGTYSVTDLSPPPSAQVQVSPNPGQVGQPVQFNVQLSSGQGVARLEWVFPSIGMLQAMQAVTMRQTGPDTWTLVQAFASPEARTSQLRVTMADGRTATLASAVVTTLAAMPPAVRVTPAAVKAGQSMTFAAQVADPNSVARGEVAFTDANVVEPLVRTAANVWSRTRTMVQAGNNRPFVIRLMLKSGATVQAGGTYTVTP